MQPGEVTPQNSELKAVLSDIQQRLSAIELKVSENSAEKQADNRTENRESSAV